MAENNEEEYLDSLLKSMLNSEDGSIDEDMPSQSLSEEYDASEDDDMAMLSRMLLGDNDIPFDDDTESNDSEEPIPIEHSDMESFFSLDDLLEAEAGEESGDISVPSDADGEDMEITPIMTEDVPVQETESDDSIEDILKSFTGETIDESDEEATVDDFFGDFNEISSLFSNESTSVNEDDLRKAMIASEENEVHDSELEKELADILALDEGMSISDIPDEQPQDVLTDEERLKVQGISSQASSTDEEDKPKKGLASLFSKKAKKAKKDKKEKPEKPKKEKKLKKEKSKSSFKEFITQLGEDDEEEDKKKKPDKNQKLIDDLYKDKKSLDDYDPDEDDDPKKNKKAKKAKKQKAPKPPKVKKEPLPQEMVHIGKIGVAIITLLFLVFLVGGFFGVRFINYQLTINSAKKYFEKGNYSLAYEELTGLDVMNKDVTFYNKVRTVMTVYQGYESYNNYIEIDREVEALDALINAVGRKQQKESDSIKYEVTDEVDAVYEQILTILEFYGIDEQKALDMFIMTNYEEYYEMLLEYEGVIQ